MGLITESRKDAIKRILLGLRNAGTGDIDAAYKKAGEDLLKIFPGYQTGTGDPTEPLPSITEGGTFYWDTSGKHLWIFDGSNWVQIL